MIPTKRKPGGWQAGPGHRKNSYFDITMVRRYRQLVFMLLPWAATVVSAFCSPSGKAGRFLDRLNVLAEGGGDDV